MNIVENRLKGEVEILQEATTFGVKKNDCYLLWSTYCVLATVLVLAIYCPISSFDLGDSIPTYNRKKKSEPQGIQVAQNYTDEKSSRVKI